MFGPGYASSHSDVVSAVLLAASLDFTTLTIAAALVEDEPVVPVRRTGILR